MIGHILVIEPFAINRILIKARLSAAHYSVKACASVDQGLDFGKAIPPNLVIINRSLGLSQIKRLREQLSLQMPTSLPPIIAIGAPLGELFLRDVYANGADSYMEWPIQFDLLKAKMRSLMRQSQKLYRLEERCIALGGLSPEPAKSAPAVIVARTRTHAQEWSKQVGFHLKAPIETITFVEAMDMRRRPDAASAYLLLADDQDTPETILHTLATLKTRPENNAAHFMITFPEGAEIEAAAALDMGADVVAKISERSQDLAARFEHMCTCHAQLAALDAALDDGLRLAVTDPLTGLHNRRFCDATLARFCSEAQSGNERVAVMVLDIDHFKKINDQHGHAGGDYVLAHVATTLRAHLRDHDLIARIGGEEFLVALPDTTTKSAVDTANLLRHAIETMDLSAPLGGLSANVRVTISVGIAITDSAYCPKYLTKEADRALYQAKSNGRNRACIAKPLKAVSLAQAVGGKGPLQGVPQSHHVHRAS